MAQLFETPADLGEYLFRILDNGGATLDRYTVVFSDGNYLGVSKTGAGFSQWGEGLDLQGVEERIESGEDSDVTLADLAPELVAHILARANEGWRDFLAAEKAAPSRAEVDEENDGTHSSGGVGIYTLPKGTLRGRYMVARDGSDDLGPFSTYRDALLATLPEWYGLSGPEYHAPDCPIGAIGSTEAESA